MKIFIKTQKFISVITALCLLISFVIGPTAANAMTNEEATAKYKQIFKDFMLPYNYGQITSSHYAGTDRVIINIQDLHCHPKVQKNISNIIEIFDKSFGVKKVYLEGVYGQLSTRWITDRIDNVKKGEILEKMLETGRLTGAEYYSAISGKTEIISGLEEKIPYLENLKRFGEIVENQEKINVILKAIDESLSKVKQQYYTKRQYKLEELSQNYREGTITPQKYYALLSKHIEKLGIDLSKYENTFTYIMLLEMQKNLDYSKITTELQNLILLLRENLANSAYQMLVDNTENFSKIDKLYGYIVRISRELGLDLTVNFPNLDNYFGYIEFSQKINPLELIVEEKKLTEEINTRFSETKAQREIVFLTNFEKYLKDYVSSKITSDDYEYYEKNIDTFRQLWNKYVDDRVLSLLDEYLAEADKFYKINNDRNIYFTNNIFTEKNVLGKLETEVEAKGDVNKIIDNMKGVKEVDVVITGGFHSQTVTEILKNHGVSYIVITPNVTDGVKLAEETYYEIAKEQSKISFQALATLPFSAYPENLRVRAAVIAFGRDIAKEIFPNKIAEIDSIDTKTFTEEETNLAQQMKDTREIISAKLLESDDNGNVVKAILELINKYSDKPVSEDFLNKIENTENFKKLLENVESLQEAINTLEKDKLGQAIALLTKTVGEYISYVEQTVVPSTEEQVSTEQQEQRQKQELIKKINAVNLSFLDSKLLEDLREETRDKLDEIHRKFDGKEIESLSLAELEEYWKLKKEILTIFEPKDEKGVKSVLEEVFADIEVFVSFIGNSAPKGDYAKIALSVSSSLAKQLSQKLGRSRLGIISSTTTDEGSIDAISTIVAQMYDALMIYVTAIDYLKYVDPKKYPGSKYYQEIQKLVGKIDKESLIKDGTNLEDFLTAFKFVAENGDIYSKSVAKANNTDSSNVAVIIGGGNVALKDDLKNAMDEKNEVFLINSRTLAKQSQAPAIDHKKLMDLNSPYAVSNAVQFVLNIIDLFNKKAISFNDKGDIIVNLPELEFTSEEKESISRLEEKKKQLAELRAKNDENETGEIRKLEKEIDEMEESLDQLKIFYYLLKEKILSDQAKYSDLITLTKDLLKKFLELSEDIGKDVITREDLHGIKIHIFDMEDEHGETADEEEIYRKAAEKVASNIFDFLENISFFKKALTHSDEEFKKNLTEESVTSERIEREAFDLQYAIKHGYVENAGVEEIKTAGGTTTRTVYKLKGTDTSKHYSKFILSDGVDGITDEFRTDVDDYAIDPMFVVYEDGSVGFMTQQDFKNVYGKKKKGKFKVTKEPTKVKVCFLNPRTIIQTKEGRVTVHSNEIVVQRETDDGDVSIYAMSISSFERLYPMSKPENRSFYEQNEEEIKRLRNAQESISQMQRSTQQQKPAAPKVQKSKKMKIRNIIASLFVTAVLIFSSLNISNYFNSVTPETAPVQEVTAVQEEQPIIYSTPNIKQISASDEMLDQLYSSFGENNSMFAPKDKDELKYSLIQSEKVSTFFQSDMGRVLSALRFVDGYDNAPEIIFMKTDSKDPNFLGSACAHSVKINGERKDFIIIPVNYNDDDTFVLEHQIFSTLVHEITHLVNKDKVDAGLMSKLQDEYEATRNGHIALTFGVVNFSNFEDEAEKVGTFTEYLRKIFDKFSQDSEYDVTFEEVYENYAQNWMRDYGLKIITQNQGTATNFFKTSFGNLYYGNVEEGVKSEDGTKNLVMIEIFDTKHKKNGIYAVIDEDGNLTIQEYVKIENIYEDGSQDEVQFEATKDGKKTRVKAKKSSKKEVKQPEKTPERKRWEEFYEIFQRAPISSNRVNKAAIIGAFARIATDLNVSREMLDKILLPLARELSERRIDNISTEANKLTFKILLSEYFQGNKLTKSRMTDYEDAMKMGRLLYYTIGDKAADLTEQQIDQILPLLMDIYYKGLEQLHSRNTVTDKTGFYCLLGMEEECTNEGWESIFKLLEINPKRDYFKCTGDYSDDKVTINGWLDTIRFYPENKAKYGLENMYAMYSGHGQPTYLSTGEHNLKVEDIVEALVDARRKGAVLSEITLDLATCWSYFSSINIIEQLKKRLEEENLEPSFPNIVTDAGYESLKGKFIDMKNSPVSISSTDLVSGSSNVTLSNKEVSLIEYILAHKTELAEREKKGLSLADFHNAERASANYTVFAVTNEEMENLFDDLRQNVFEILGLSSDEITYGTKEMEITEYLDRYEEHERTVLVQRWLAKKGNMIYMELLLAKTKAILDWIGNTKIIRALYKDKAGENFKNTKLGKAIGVNLETFAFWMPKFVAAHNFRYASQDSGARAVVWRIRSLSIGIGMGFGVLSAIINLINPITATIAIPAIITTLVATALTANTFHYFYDIGVYNGIDPSELENMINDIDREQAIRNAKLEEIQPGFGQLIEQKSRIMTISEFFKEKGFVGSAKELGDSDGIALGLLSHELLKNEKNEGIFVKLISAICRTTNIADWQIALRYFADRKPEWGLVGVTSDKYMPELVEYCKRTNKKIYFFLPNETKEYSRTRGQAKVDPRIANNESSRTRNELKWLKDHPEALPYVEFVVGAYDFLDVESVEEYNKYFSDDKKTTDTVSAMLRTPELFGEQTQSRAETQGIKLLSQPKSQEKRAKASPATKQENQLQQYFSMNQDLVTQQQVLDKIFDLMKNLSEGQKQELYGTNIGYLKRYLGVITELAKYGNNLDLSDIHDDLYYFINAGMIADIAISIFAPYYKKEITYEQFKTKVDKAKILMKYFRTNGSEKHNFLDLLWFGDLGSYFLEQNKALVDRIYRIGIALDKFIEEQNINISISDNFGRNMGEMLQTGFEAGKSNRYIIRNLESYLKGEITRSELMDKLKNGKENIETDYPVEKQQILNQIFNLMKNLSEENRQQLSELNIDSLDNFLEIITELTKYGKDINDSYDDLYYFVKEGMIPSIAIGIFKPYFEGKESIKKLKENINKVRTLMKYFKGYHNSGSNVPWYEDMQTNLFEQNKALVDRVYKIGRNLDRFIEKENINVDEINFDAISSIIHVAIYAQKKDRYITNAIKKYLKGNNKYVDSLLKGYPHQDESLDAAIKREYIKLTFLNYKYVDIFINEIDMASFSLRDKKVLLEKLITQAQDLDEGEVKFLASQVRLLLASSGDYNSEITFTANSLEKINRTSLDFLMKKGKPFDSGNYFASFLEYLSSNSAMLFLELLSTDIEVNESNYDSLKDLINALSSRDICHLALENNAFALRVFLNPEFQRQYKDLPVLTQYRSAIKIGRFMEVTGTISTFRNQDLEKQGEIIKKAIDTLSKILDESGRKVFIDEKTKIIIANHNERWEKDGLKIGESRFNSNAYRKMLNTLGISEEDHLVVYEETGIDNFYERIGKIYNFLRKHKKVGMFVLRKKENEIDDVFKKIVFRLFSLEARIHEEKQKKLINNFLNEIPKFRYKEGIEENLLVVLNGHGGSGTWYYSENGHIEIDRIAQAIETLVKNMKKEGRSDEEIKKTIEHITIDLSCCHSYETADILKQSLIKRNVQYCPQIVAEAGREMVLGYTLGWADSGNLEYSINEYLKTHQDATEITFKDIFYSEIKHSNHTIFMVDDAINGLFNDFVEYVKNLESNTGQSQEKIPEVSHEKKSFFLSATVVSSDFIRKFAQILNKRHGSSKVEGYSSVELQTEETKEYLRQKAVERGYENPDEFRLTFIGKVMGVWHEMLPFWKIFSIHTAIFGKEINVNSFIEEHENPTMAQIIAVWVIRALSIGLGVGTGAILAASFTPFAGIFGIPALLATEFITHLMWNLRKPQATVLFNKESSQISFLINKEGNKYSLIFNPRTGGIYLSSNNEDAFSDASQAITKSEYATPESIEQLLDLKINISGHSITVKSNDTGATVSAVKHSNIPKIISSLSKGELITSQEDENVLKLLKEHLHIEGDVETVYLDREDRENRPQANRALEGNKLLVVYPFSNFYDINSLTDEQLFSLYLQLNNNLLDALKTWLPALSDDKLYFVGVTILNEFVKNAIVHGNLADLSKPLYIKYDENGFTVYNAYNGKTNKRRLSVSAAAGLSGAHVGLSLVQKNVDDGVVSVTPEQERIVEIGDRTFYAIGAFQSNKIQKISEGYPERAEAPYYHHGTSLQSALQILADGKLRTDVPMANGYHPAEIYMVEASYVPLMEAKYSINSGYDFARGYATNDQGIVDGVVLGFAGKTRHYKPIPKTLGFDMKELSLSGDEEGNVRLSEISFSSDEYLENFIKEMLAKNIKLPKNVAFRVKNNKVDKYISRNELEKIISDLESQQTAPQVETKPQVQQQQTVPQVETKPQTQQQQTAPQVEQQAQQEQETVETEEGVTSDRTPTIVFNKKSLRNLINRIKEKIKGFSKKQTSIDEDKLVDVLEQALSEIENNPMLVSMEPETHNSVKFDVCNFEPLQKFIEGSTDNKKLGDAINNLLKAAILSDDKIFTQENYDAIRDYIHGSETISTEEKNRRIDQIKVIARIYGYISFKNKFFEDGKNKGKTLTNNSVIEINGQKLSLYQWIHICDGHSIALNGNEDKSSSPDQYSSPERALAAAITMEQMKKMNIPSIKENPDLILLQDGRTLYIKKEEGTEFFDVVIESVDGDLVTVYISDGEIIKRGNKYDISKFIGNIKADVFVNQNEQMFDFPTGMDCFYKKDAEGKVFRRNDDGQWQQLSEEENGLLKLSVNIISLEGTNKLNKISELILQILRTKIGKTTYTYYYNRQNGKWYENQNGNLVEANYNNIEKSMEKFNIDGKDYYFLSFLNGFIFDEHFKLVPNDVVLGSLTKHDKKYATHVDIKDGKKRLLLFDYSTRTWLYTNLGMLNTRIEGRDKGLTAGIKSYYILSNGLLVTMDGVQIEKIQVNDMSFSFKEIKQNKGQTKIKETVYVKIAGEWYSYLKSNSKSPEYSSGTIDFISDGSRYLYADNKVYEMMDNNELVEIQNVEMFDVNVKKYMNLNSQLYEIIKEDKKIVPVNEEQVNNLKADSQYGEWFTLLFDRINPVGLTLSLVSQIFDTNRAMNMKGKNIIVDVDVDEALRERAKSAGINIVKLRIITEQEARQRGGSLINEQAKIRMTFDSSANELLVYSKQGINLNREKIKELIAAAYSEGRKNLEFSDEQVIAFAESGEISSNIEQSLANIQDRIANAAVDGLQRAEVEVSLDLSGMKNIGRNLASKCNKQFATTIIINTNQLNKYGSEINGLRADGFRFILRGSITEIQDAFENASDKGYLLDGVILEGAERGDLSKLEELAANNTEGTLHIETQMYVNMATAKGIDANRIYDDNGIIPIVTADQVETMTGKYAVGYSEIKNKIDNTMLGEGKIINILCTEDEGNRPDDLRSKLAGIFSDLFGTMNELLKPKSPEQRITEETAAVSDYNFGKEFGEEIKNVRERLLGNLREGGTIKTILTTEFTEENEAKTAVNNFIEDENSIYKQLPSAIQMRIQTAISKGNYFEAIGTIRGAVNQIIDSFVLGQSAFETEDQVKLRDKYLKKEYKEYRQYVRIRALQLVMAGENLSSLLESRPDTNQTVEQLFDAIRTELNKDVRKTIIANKTAIKEIKAKDEIENAKTNLMNVNILLDDSLRDRLVVTKQLDVSAQTIRSILAAA